VSPPAAPPSTAQTSAYLFHDEFDGPAGSAPDAGKWMVAKARETIRNPVFWDRPENMGQDRDDRQNVFIDGKSNLVIRATRTPVTECSAARAFRIAVPGVVALLLVRWPPGGPSWWAGVMSAVLRSSRREQRRIAVATQRTLTTTLPAAVRSSSDAMASPALSSG
jgi:hypothetical protein